MTKILYVEDNEDNVYMLSRRLKRKGFDIVIAVDGEQGVKMASSEKPDLILMDLSLPQIDGWTATKHRNSNDDLKSIPIIAPSAPQLRTLLTCSGVDIPKPTAIGLLLISLSLTMRFSTLFSI